MTNPTRIAQCLQRLEAQNRKALIPYFVAGDPSIDATSQMMHKLVDAGSDIIELGIAFSDPMAEGPTIQLAHERALENQVTLDKTLAQVAKFREIDNETPVVLMGYANPIEVRGYEAFAKQAQAAGIDGMLIVDLPPEEGKECQAVLKEHGIDIIFLIAPTTAKSRVKEIADAASGYLYYVSLKGVTGAGHLDVASVEAKMAEIRSLTDLPVCVGFGIKDADSAKKIAQFADGAVVGSAIVDRIGAAENDVAAMEAVESFTKGIRQALDEL